MTPVPSINTPNYHIRSLKKVTPPLARKKPTGTATCAFWTAPCFFGRPAAVMIADFNDKRTTGRPCDIRLRRLIEF